MSVNSSSSLHHPNFSLIPVLPNVFCYVTRPSSLFYAAYYIADIIIFLPLCTFILHRGFHQRRQRSSSSSSETLSHVDCFTLHLVVMELIGVVGYVFFTNGIFRVDLKLLFIGNTFTVFVWYGELLFHVLTCAERYLAVVHPVSYLKLGKEKRVRIRNVSIVCVWLLSFLGMGSGMVKEPVPNFFLILDIFQFFLFITVLSFCSVSVLHVLTRPGPGEQGDAKRRVDQSKQRAFYIIVTILGVLVLKFIWNLVWEIVCNATENTVCIVLSFGNWFELPCSLVLPLQFLHRTEKSVCFKKKCCFG